MRRRWSGLTFEFETVTGGLVVAFAPASRPRPPSRREGVGRDGADCVLSVVGDQERGERNGVVLRHSSSTLVRATM